MQVKLPPLGEGATSGTVSGILVKVGDAVAEGQPLIELESEKAVALIPSPSSGKVAAVLVSEGDQISVGQALVNLDGGDEGTEAPSPSATHEADGEKPEQVSVAPSGRLVHDRKPAAAVKQRHEPPPGFPPPASPSIRKLARSLGIDLRLVSGSERGGRITMDDLREFISSLQGQRPQEAAPGATAQPPVQGQSQVPDFGVWGPVRREKISQLRSVISRKMVESWTQIPHVTQFDYADITELQRKRKIHSPYYKKKNANLTLTPFILKALVDVLKDHPMFNASLDPGSNEIVYKDYFHLGIAVDTEHGLLVPVIRDVDRKTLLDLSLELSDLAERARTRKVTLEEMQGGSFTISNQGGIGGGLFTPIINAPEVAILGIGRGSEQPVFRTLRPEKRSMLPLALSYDHRLIDGADAARFMVALNERLGNFKESELKLKQ